MTTEQTLNSVKILNKRGELLREVLGADLSGADLYGANLRGANLRGANLYGADLCGAKIDKDQSEALFAALGVEVRT